MNRRAVTYYASSEKSASLELPYTNCYIIVVRCILYTNANSRSVKVYLLESWSSTPNTTQIGIFNGATGEEMNIEFTHSNGKPVINVSSPNNGRIITIYALRLTSY